MAIRYSVIFKVRRNLHLYNKIARSCIMLFLVSCSQAMAQMTIMIPAFQMTCIPKNSVVGPDGNAHEYAPYELAWDGQSKLIIKGVGVSGTGNAVNVERASEKSALMQSTGGAHAYRVKLDFEQGSATFSYGRVDKCVVTSKNVQFSEFDRFPAKSIYLGKPKMPEFAGKDRNYRQYRTRIQNELAGQAGSNFAGRFNLVDITVTGGVQIAIVESATGRVKWLGVIDGPWPGRDYAFRGNSRLLVSQSSNGERCWIDNYLWTGADFQKLGDPIEKPINSEGYCKDALPNSAFGRPAGEIH